MFDKLAQLDLAAGKLLPLHPHLSHPRTGARLQAVGFRRNGTPIWPVLGAADDDGDDDKSDDDDDDDADKGKKSDDDNDEDDDDKPLGPKGEKALQAEKDKRRRARDAQRAAEKERDDLQAELDRLKGKSKDKKKSDDDDDDDDKDDRQRTAGDEAEARANAKIVRAEAKSIAADLGFIDPSDAGRYLDLSKYEVDDDGEVEDSDDLRDDLKKILADKPHLKGKGKRFQGSGDGGRQGDDKKPDPGPGQARMRAAYASSGKK